MTSAEKTDMSAAGLSFLQEATGKRDKATCATGMQVVIV
jgi:hypothetical protein